METKWECLKVESHYTGHPYSLRIGIHSPTRFPTDWIRRNRPTVKITEESILTYFYATFQTTDTKVMSWLEMELVNMLGNDGWEAFAVRRIPAEREGEKPTDEFYFKRPLQMSTSQPLRELYQEPGAQMSPMPPPIIGDTSGPKPPQAFDVVLVGFPADKKIATITALREVKPGLALAEAMELVATLPSKVFNGVSETVARAAKEKLEQAGAGVRLDRMTFV
jgi:ribosomal protein L7/L12